MKKWIRFLLSVLICLLAGFIGSFFTVTSADSWYSGINKPSFNPPNWVFGPVWTILYTLMGISLFLLWESKSRHKKGVLIIFFTQLVLNSLWSILFFGLQSPLFAFLEIIVLWTAIIATVLRAYRISKAAAYLLMPYIFWVSFAAVLNFSIYLLNG